MNDKKLLSLEIEEIRNLLFEARSRLQNESRQFCGFQRRIDNVCGLLTCGLIVLHDIKADAVALEMENEERERGKSLSFIPRGIGSDTVPGCFVCGNGRGLLRNISAFVNSKEDGENIVSWFSGLALLDYREHEPNWSQVKVGACPEHEHSLAWLMCKTAARCMIRFEDIKDAKEVAKSGVSEDSK